VTSSVWPGSRLVLKGKVTKAGPAVADCARVSFTETHDLGRYGHAMPRAFAAVLSFMMRRWGSLGAGWKSWAR
jgi:hypothetical protein